MDHASWSFLPCSAQAVSGASERTKAIYFCILQSPSHRRPLVTASGNWRCCLWCRKELLPKAFLPTKFSLAPPPREWQWSCYCKVQVPRLPQYTMEMCSETLSNLSQTPLFLKPAPPSAFHYTVFTQKHWHSNTGFDMRRLFLWEEFCARGFPYSRFHHVIHTMYCQVTISNGCHMGPKFCTSCGEFQPQNLWVQIVLWVIVIWNQVNKRPGRYRGCCLSGPLLFHRHCPASVSLYLVLHMESACFLPGLLLSSISK